MGARRVTFLAAFERMLNRIAPAVSAILLATALQLFSSSGLMAQVSETKAAGGEIAGSVKSGNMPLPGVTVSASQTLTGQKVVTSTDGDGTYSLTVPADGRYVVRTQLAAFAPATKEVLIHASNRKARVDFELILLSRAQEAAREQQRQATAPNGRGFQNLSVMQEEAGGFGAESGAMASPSAASETTLPGMPIPGLSPDSPTESVAISGNAVSSGPTFMSSEEIRQRLQAAREQQGGMSPGGEMRRGGGGGGGGGGMGPFILMGGGRGRRFDINRPHGAIFYTLGDSAFDAKPYSLSGEPTAKPAYAQHRFGAVLGGPLNIPKIYKGGGKTFFFLAFTGSRASNPFDAFSTVPTLAERNGNFADTRLLSGPNAGSPVQIFDPQTHSPFPGNIIPASRINAAAAGLLPFIPLPNLPGDVQNFHFVTSATDNSNNVNLRLMHNFGASGSAPGPRWGGPRNNLNFGLHYHTEDSTQTNPFPSVGGSTSIRGIDVPIGYVRSKGKLTNILRADFNRNRILTQNLYGFVQNVAGELGISGVSQNPFDWGLPNLSFTHFSGLRDINPLLRRDQTFSISDFMVWNHGRHTLRWGGDFRRIQLNTETDSNARGSFIFTGLNTAAVAGGLPVAGTGFDFADFLLGLPQQTSVQFGKNSYHFRGNSWDLFVQDEWRATANLTLNLGLRYEYVSPFREVNNLIVNLDAAPGFTAVVPVLPGQFGAFTGVFPAALMNPDRNNFAPRVGIAWKPLPKTVVRAGYSIHYNTGAYAGIVQQLAFQPPFSFTQTNIESAALPLTLENGFPAAPPTAVTNNFGVDRNYRLGYVQIWNLDLQFEITPGVVLNLDYTGTKGTHLDILRAPDRGPDGLLIPNVQPFLWESSEGNSIAHAGTVRLRKRLQHGLSIGGSYTFSKSIDNASSIGGGATVVAQNDLNLAAERGLSSFDQRHRFTADYLWELPWGTNRRWLAGKGFLPRMFGDWQWSGSCTIASGTPFTARVLGDFADVSRGTNGTLRANATGLPVSLSDASIAEFFNTAAFSLPPPGQFGNAGRNTIPGPGSVTFNMAITKLIPMGDVRVLEIRAQASNIFNTPRYAAIDTTVNSLSFGRVVAVSAMRQIQIVTRFRF